MAAQAAENLSNQVANPREPSMEEILASIRRIIEDSDGKPEQPFENAANAAGSPHRPANSQTPRHIETVKPQAAGPVVQAAVAAAQPDRQVERQAQPAQRLEQPLRPAAPAVPADVAKNSIISDVAGRQVAAAFGELSDAFAATRRRSFDEIAEEMMRPMLQEWLDDNLPTLVERLVREEIERIARVGSR